MKKYKSKQRFYKLANISNKKFLANRKLIGKYGLRYDTDRDGRINLYDCYPFDKKRHGILYNFFGPNPISSFLAKTFGTPSQGTIYLKPGEVSQAGPMQPGGPIHTVPGGYTSTTSGGAVGTGTPISLITPYPGGINRFLTPSIAKIFDGGGTLTPSIAKEIIQNKLNVSNAPQKRAILNYLQNRKILLQRRVGGRIDVNKLNKVISQEYNRFIQHPKVRGGINIVDIISGGKVTERKFGKEQEQLNKQTEEFNKKYGGRELSEQEYRNAQLAKRVLDYTQQVLERKSKTYESSGKKKWGDFLWGNFPIAQKDYNKQLGIEQDSLKKTQSQIEKYENKKGLVNTLVLKKLRDSEGNILEQIDKLKQGYGASYRIIAGQPPPITPTQLYGMGKPTNIKFIGRQKIKGNNIITDIAFQTVSKSGKVKTIGIARGVTLSRGKQGITRIVGRSGRVGVKFPTARIKAGRIQSFAGIEKSISKPSQIKIRTLLRGARGEQFSIQRGIKSIKQLSAGRVAQIKGLKFKHLGARFPTGKLLIRKARGIQIDDFVSSSQILTKGDISRIIGRTITRKGNRANFIGIIKGEKSLGSLGKFSTGTKQQYRQALKKIVSTVAFASVKVDRVKGLSQVSRNIITASIIKKALSKGKSGSGLIQKIKSIKITPIIISKAEQIGETKQRGATGGLLSQGILQEVRTRQGLRLTPKQESKLKQKIVQIYGIKSKQKQAQKFRQLQKQITKQGLKFRTPSFFPPIKPRIPLLRIPRRKRKTGIIRKKSSPLQAFNVYGKSGKKFVRLNTKPLKKIDALSRGTFAIDHTTSRSFKIVPAGKKRTFGALRKSERNYFNRAGYKLREYKVKRGRAFQIKPKYIERTKYGIDTRGEKRGLTIAKFVRQQRRGTIHTGKYIRRHRRITPTQRRIMLRNLAKARRVLARRKR